MGNAINRQRYVMAQGYTYKVLVNITKGLTKEQIESINGYRLLCTQRYVEDSLRQVVFCTVNDCIDTRYRSYEERRGGEKAFVTW